MDEQHSDSPGNTGDSTQRLAAVYGAAFGFGFCVAMFSALEVMVETQNMSLTDNAVPLFLALPILSALSSVVTAKQAKGTESMRNPWLVGIFLGAALGAIGGIVSLAVYMGGFDIRSVLAFAGMSMGSIYSAIAAVPGALIGALVASVLVWLLGASPELRRRIPAIGCLLGLMVGAVVPLAMLAYVVSMFSDALPN